MTICDNCHINETNEYGESPYCLFCHDILSKEYYIKEVLENLYQFIDLTDSENTKGLEYVCKSIDIIEEILDKKEFFK